MADCSVTDVPAEDFPQKNSREVERLSLGVARGLNIWERMLKASTP
jgi:hypothetical protein